MAAHTTAAISVLPGRADRHSVLVGSACIMATRNRAIAAAWGTTGGQSMSPSARARITASARL